jgi:hypothetical protein
MWTPSDDADSVGVLDGSLDEPDGWLERTDSGVALDTPLSLDRWRRHVIDERRPSRAVFVLPGDFDGDGFVDVAAGAFWYQNPGTASGAWIREPIGEPLRNVAALEDFDGDGDLDIFGTQGQGSEASADFAWAQNDGRGNFTIRTNIESGQGDFPQGVCVDRFGTRRWVVLSWHRGGVGVQALTIPSDPTSGKWPWNRISTTSQDEQLSCGDVDRDSDSDILLGTMWLRNDEDGFTAREFSALGGKPDRNRLADLNGDGRLDAVVGYEAISVRGKLAWYEQGSDAEAHWEEHVIANDVIGPMSLDVRDLDGDSDLDVVVGEHNLSSPDSARLLVYENVDGVAGRFESHLVHRGDEHHDGAQLFDLEGDGDLDIVSIGWGHPRVVVYENLAL